MKEAAARAPADLRRPAQHGRGEPQGGGDRGSRIPRPLWGQHPLGAGRRGVSCCSSFFNNHTAALERAKKMQRNQSVRRRPRATAPGRRRRDLGKRRRGPLPREGVLRNSWKRNERLTLWPDLGKTPCGCPVGQAPSVAPQQRAASGRAAQASPSAHPQKQERTPCLRGFVSKPTSLGLAGPRGAVRQTGANPRRGTQGFPGTGGSWPQVLAPIEAGLELRVGALLSVFKRGRQVARYSESGLR